jgi:hypothetical protein
MPGGSEILGDQLRYHRAVAEAAAAADPTGAMERLRSRFPGFLLEEVIPTSLARWRQAS